MFFASIIFCKSDQSSVAIDIETTYGKICLACIYRSTSLPDSKNDILLDCIMNICNESNNFETILTGDFNLPDVSWANGLVSGCSVTKKFLNLQLEYLDLFTQKGLKWYLTNEITRRRMVAGTLQESLLDQVLSTNDALVSSFKILSPLGKSDHVCINIDLGISFGNDSYVNKEVIRKPCWSKVSKDNILNFSSENINWSYSSYNLNVEEMWEELHGKLSKFIDIVPTARFDSSNRPLKPPWGSSALKRMRLNKDKAWDVFDASPLRENLDYALTKQSIYENEEFRLKYKYEQKLTKNLKYNSKGFFSYLRNKRKLKTCIPALERADGTLSSTASESANALADAFGSVFIEEPSGDLPGVSVGVTSDKVITDIVIEFDNVTEELAKLNEFKSIGPDGIHPKILKALSSDTNFVNALVCLFKKCTDSEALPKVWKQATVSALYKSGSKKEPLNYRPVSLTCIICKVYEQLVRSSLVEFLDEKITPYQHGFVKSKSCLTNLLETVDCIIELLESGAPVDLIYFDFSKAFDRVPHSRLLYKLETLGVKGKLLNVIKDFLTGRSFRVSVEGKLSSLKKILSGIPQGSVLGPLLFIIFINDLPNYVKSSIRLFADDLKLIGNAGNRNVIDEDLRQLEQWEREWLLEFNHDKCKVVHTNVNDNPKNKYILDGKVMKESDHEKDLGVLTSDTLLWTDQITSCVSKTNQLICWITRNIINRDKNVMIPVYKTLIRPHLEYCVQLWNPAPEHGNWSLILQLESVQRRFTRMIDGVGLLPYSERLEILKLTTLTERRCRGDLIEVFKAKNSFSKLNGVFSFGRSGINLVSSLNAYSGSSKFKKLKRNFINERVVSYWNKLPTDVKTADTVNIFKNKLEQFKIDFMHDKSEMGHFWELSDEVLKRIQGNNYILNKEIHNEYLKANPFVAKKKFINLY